MNYIPYYDRKTGKVEVILGNPDEFSVLSFLKYLPNERVEQTLNKYYTEENDIEE